MYVRLQDIREETDEGRAGHNIICKLNCRLDVLVGST